ncbi:CLUMA_CG015929, isoform A [Clunio marinus]|uniref:CLUMA_CG015929, isoform A n=1 Tax=Clunio marinus TaxID=568069 RepID=A0A1J1IS86_9DIPT|nr:CLUMA_CG015929, isoform A [Clunio marinus]
MENPKIKDFNIVVLLSYCKLKSLLVAFSDFICEWKCEKKSESSRLKFLFNIAVELNDLPREFRLVLAIKEQKNTKLMGNKEKEDGA